MAALAKRIERSEIIPFGQPARYIQAHTVYAYSVIKVSTGEAPEKPLFVWH